MKHPVSKLFAGILAAALLLSGCGRDAGEPDGAEPGAPRGRYVEAKLAMPEDLSYAVTVEQMEDGSIRVFGIKAAGEPGPQPDMQYRVWSSGDSGASWVEEDMPWYGELDAMAGESFDQAAFLSPDELYLGSMAWVPDAPEVSVETPPEEEGATEPTGDGEEDEEDVVSFHSDGQIVSNLYRVGKDGLGELGHSLLSEIGDDDVTTTPSAMSLAGDYLMLSYYGYSKLLDPKTGEEVLRFPVQDDLMHGSYAFTGDRLIAAQKSGFLLFDRETGDQQDELPLTGLVIEEGAISYSGNPANMTALTLAEDQTAIFYVNASGLYRMTLDGAVTEKLMDGDLTTIGMPSVYVTHLFRNADGSFLVFASAGREGAPALFRYTFDPNLPSVPTNELSVYSLSDNQTIRQAIGQMQQGDADVKVNYRVGMGDANAVTAADALRTLSTEMLAGNGPDVMVLDGIPVDSYVEKGALADLTGLLDERIASGGLIPGVAETFRRDGKLYAIPARFSVPMLHGVDIGSITDFDSLAGWLGAKGVQDIGISGDMILGHFYDMLSPRWFLEGGGLDEERFAADLEVLRSYALSSDVDYYDLNHMADFGMGAVAVKGGFIPLNLSKVNGLLDVAGPSSLIAESGEGEVKLFPEGGMFIPGTVLGVNAASAKTELAEQFVEAVLSEEALTQDFQDGLPVSEAALMAQAAGKADFERAYGTSSMDPETGEYVTVVLEIKEPSDEYMNGALDAFRSLTVPSFANIVVRDMVLAEGTPYIRGETTLEEAVAALAGKLDLYLAE